MKASRLKERGITLIESVATLGIMSAVAIGTVIMSSQYTEDTRTTGAAEHMVAVAEAARLYVRDNRANVMALATATQPVMISVSSLSASGYLPSGFSSTNAFRQNVCALVLEPSSGVLNTLVVAEGGDRLDDVHLAHFSSLMGAAGGGRFTTNSANLQGAGGGWTLPLATFNNRANTAGKRCNNTTAGAVQITLGTPVYAQWMSASDTADPGFLSRDVVPGNPGANTMQTHINMGGNRITNLDAVTAGAACGAGVNDGEIARGSRSEVLSCRGGLWERQGMAYFGANVTNHSNLPACNASRMGELRRVTAISGLFICDGMKWDVALNEANNFVLPQHLAVRGDARVYGDARVDGDAAFYGNVTASQGIAVGAGKTISNAGRMHIETGENLYLKPWNANGQVIVGGGGGGGKLTTVGRLATNEYLHINGTATKGVACAPNGLVARNASGLLMSCQSGKWVELGGTGYTEFYVTNGRYPFQSGVKDPACGSGWTELTSWIDHAGDYGMDVRRLRLCGRSPGAVPPSPPTVPTGTLCGTANQDSKAGLINISLCQGHNPRYSCPTGYTQKVGFQAASNYYYTCSKN